MADIPHNVEDKRLDDSNKWEVGIIGAGDMGILYATKFSSAGYKVNICDLPSKYDDLVEKYKDTKWTIMRDGFAVSRRSDLIIYSVEAVNIDKVVKEYGKATKVGAVVAGQTSVKEPEIKAFEAYLPEDVHIITCHSLHGPNVDTEGQPLVVIRHRSDDYCYNQTLEVFKCLKSQMVFLGYKEHDRITADTQAATHLAYLSLGTAWKTQGYHPWENPQFIAGIDNVKIGMALRIYASKYHVYAGLAIMNPAAKTQLRHYVDALTMLYKMMVGGKDKEFTDLVYKAADFVFGKSRDKKQILLSDELLDRYSLSQVPKENRLPNSQLSLLATAVCWYNMKTNPYDSLICQTPPFRLWLGIVEYLFCNAELLKESVEAALNDRYTQAEDLVFYSAVTSWGSCIQLGSFDGYREMFEETAAFFKDRLVEGKDLSTQMINEITRKIKPNVS
ncbi:prephenate dehydrogenase (NADP(+)) [Mycoemilia scoparia]|uniref:Prephenate dehydrogenase (NADP(+)) n=1 Tax=Mycoemilia scoparia TaxID=417184 RepID=A0A9W7ZXQ6_9FUNG|nr:prephenate dehydrogenase (NADP(+)) [Mycoemilia scoparia]